jgi:hypothetical protein
MKSRQTVALFATVSVVWALLLIAGPLVSSSERALDATFYSVKAFGAAGDGKTLDTSAINKAIESAAAAGGGTVYFPAGNYLSISIHCSARFRRTVFIRHVRGLEMNDVAVSYLKEDARSPFVISDAMAIELRQIKAQHGQSVPSLILKDVRDFSIQQSYPLPDIRLGKVQHRQF